MAHFSFDVIFSVRDLKEALGLRDLPKIEKDECEDIYERFVSEHLGINYIGPTGSTSAWFDHYIIFNSRENEFAVVYGLPLAKLRELVSTDPQIHPGAEAAKAHLINAFSMCSHDGSDPTPVDLHHFRGCFTPEFYPHRYRMKDPIYAQRLDILARLLDHLLHRYSKASSPAVKYVEFSIGVGDLCRPQVFDVLRSMETLLNDSHLPSSSFRKYHQLFLLPERPTYDIKYRFLAGFSRTSINLPRGWKQDEGLRFLYTAPTVAINLLRAELGTQHTFMFVEAEKNLAKLASNFTNASNDLGSYQMWVVGLDLMSDELGYPYCPFVTQSFLHFVEQRRFINPCFGLRIHGGENVPAVAAGSSGFALTVSHMYILLLALEFLQENLPTPTFPLRTGSLWKGLRLGHGTVLHFLIEQYNRLDRYDYHQATLDDCIRIMKTVMRHVPIEINLTSNFYLLPTDHPSAPTGHNTHAAESFLKDLSENPFEIPIVLSTDNDGIWPIDSCVYNHPGHISLAAEHCLAVSRKLVCSFSMLSKIMDNGLFYAFCADLPPYGLAPHRQPQPSNTVRLSSPYTLLFHPNCVAQVNTLPSPLRDLLITKLDTNDIPHTAQAKYGWSPVSLLIAIASKHWLQHYYEDEQRPLFFWHNSSEVTEARWAQIVSAHDELKVLSNVSPETSPRSVLSDINVSMPVLANAIMARAEDGLLFRIGNVYFVSEPLTNDPSCSELFLRNAFTEIEFDSVPHEREVRCFVAQTAWKTLDRIISELGVQVKLIIHVRGPGYVSSLELREGNRKDLSPPRVNNDHTAVDKQTWTRRPLLIAVCDHSAVVTLALNYIAHFAANTSLVSNTLNARLFPPSEMTERKFVPLMRQTRRIAARGEISFMEALNSGCLDSLSIQELVGPLKTGRCRKPLFIGRVPLSDAAKKLLSTYGLLLKTLPTNMGTDLIFETRSSLIATHMVRSAELVHLYGSPMEEGFQWTKFLLKCTAPLEGNAAATAGTQLQPSDLMNALFRSSSSLAWNTVTLRRWYVVMDHLVVWWHQIHQHLKKEDLRSALDSITFSGCEQYSNISTSLNNIQNLLEDITESSAAMDELETIVSGVSPATKRKKYREGSPNYESPPPPFKKVYKEPQ